MFATSTNNRRIAHAVDQRASFPVLSQAGVVKMLVAVASCPPKIKID